MRIVLSAGVRSPIIRNVVIINIIRRIVDLDRNTVRVIVVKSAIIRYAVMISVTASNFMNVSINVIGSGSIRSIVTSTVRCIFIRRYAKQS